MSKDNTPSSSKKNTALTVTLFVTALICWISALLFGVREPVFVPVALILAAAGISMADSLSNKKIHYSGGINVRLSIEGLLTLLIKEHGPREVHVGSTTKPPTEYQGGGGAGNFEIVCTDSSHGAEEGTPYTVNVATTSIYNPPASFTSGSNVIFVTDSSNNVTKLYFLP